MGENVGEKMSEEQKKERIVRDVEDIVFYTDTDESNYPIFIDSSNNVVIKRKISDVIATFYVANVYAADESVTHPLLETAITAVREITKSDPGKVQRVKIEYEVYRGEREEFIASVTAYAVKVISRETPYSGKKLEGRKAWAVAYDWQKRISAKYPQLSKYVYVKGEEGRKGRATAYIIVKLPIVTSDFRRVAEGVLGLGAAAEAASDIEARITEIERMIEVKRRELEELTRELEMLRMRAAVEKMKVSLQ